MKKNIIAALFLSISVQSGQIFAAEDSSQITDAEIKKILARTQSLEREARMLRVQLTRLQAQKQHQTSAITSGPVSTKAKAKAKSLPASENIKPTQESLDADYRSASLNNEVTEELIGTHYYDGAPIVISPFIGIRSAFEPNDLVVNITDVNTDLRLLRQRNRLIDERRSHNLPTPEHPLLEIGGQVEAQAIWNNPYQGDTSKDIDVASAELDIAAEINRWATGFISVDYDNSATDPQRISNSRFFMKRGFVSIGNLDESPFYATFGQIFLPTGEFNSYMVSAPVTQTMARIRERSVLFGYQQDDANPWNGAVFAFHGDTQTDDRMQYGANIEKVWNFGSSRANAGIGYTSNIAEASGMQNTGGSEFVGFAGSSAAEQIQHRVPALSIHGDLSIDQYDFIAEYISSIRSFANSDLTFNGNGARPSVLNLEANYRFKIYDVSASFALGYGYSREALALNVPKHRYMATLNTSIWKGTIESLEYRHDVNYGSGTSAAGRSGAASLATVSSSNLGKSSDMLTAQVGIYF